MPHHTKGTSHPASCFPQWPVPNNAGESEAPITHGYGREGYSYLPVGLNFLLTPQLKQDIFNETEGSLAPIGMQR